MPASGSGKISVFSISAYWEEQFNYFTLHINYVIPGDKKFELNIQ